MKQVTINGLVIEFDETLDVEITDGKITLRGKPAPETHLHYHTYPAAPGLAYPYIQPYWPVPLTGSPVPAAPYTITWGGDIDAYCSGAGSLS